ncbi:Structural maintenance of chromosomes protein 4 [Nakaseomyces glabratus]|uniref:Structural maintenance of chromosomes protein 4 n=1 Tax=Candida glabrata TaxID=5478 RepID=A0A0W0CI17_CANGB|nr:Structural maintenance of chromosomes protein 4 [Nakaseomyces glabratus]
MSDRPVSKRQKVTEEDEEEDVIHTPKAVTFEQSPRAITPRNLLGSENRSVLPTGGSQNLQIPSLLPPESLGSARGRDFKSYSQSPPRSPGRSPTRRLKLIELSPIKNSRAELQKLYEKREKNSLESGKEEALQFLNKEKELVLEKSKLYQYNLMQDNKKLDDVLNKKTNVQQEQTKQEDEFRKANSHISDITASLNVLKADLEKVHTEEVNLSKTKRTLENKKVENEQIVNNLDSKRKEFEEQSKILQDKINSTDQEIQTIIEEQSSLAEGTTVLSTNLDIEKEKLENIKLKLREKTEHLTIQIAEYEKELSPWNEQSQQLKKEIKITESELSIIEENRKGLENDIAGLENAILSQKRDLEVQEQEIKKSGQQCIEYLRKNKLGYARFILLDKLNTFNTNRIDTPDQSQRLFDLITVKEKRFNNAFYSVLRDTLVCQNMEQANRVAYGKKRYRVVTLDGNLIDLSGTMTGGGRNVSKGLMKLSKSSSKGSAFVSPEEVQAIENELNQKENQYKSALDAYHEMEEELRRLRDRAPEIDNLVSKKEMDIETAHNDINSNINVLEEKRKKLESMKNQNDPSITLLAKLKELKSKLDDIDVQTKSTKDKIKTIKDKIIELGGDELKNQSLLVTDITNKISENSRRLKKLKSNKLKKESLLKKFNKELTEANEELANFSKNAENADIESKEIESKLLDIKESIENLKENEVKLEHEIEMKHNKLESHQKVVSDYKSISLEYNNKLEKLEASEASLKKSIKRYNDLLSELTIRDVTQVLNTIMTEENASVDKSDPKLENTSAVINADDDGISAVSENQSFNHNDENDDIDSNKMEIDSQGGFINPGIPVLSASELAKVDPQEVELLITSLDDFITSSEANVDVLEEYALRFVEFNRRKNDLNSAVQSRDSVKDRLEGIKRKRYDEFMEGFKIISMTLKEMYQMITLGGNAELELVDSLDPFSEGVTFSVMPPKKSWRNISNLSGGEKTLSSLALVFALHKYKPTPLYVMDEIDAALDFRNVSIVANYIKERTKNAQFIVISLRNNMFELTKQLVGIYKHENMTKSAALVNEDLVGRA